MKVLVACEFSGIVRDAFAARGHDAWSCDLLPTERPGQHIEGDVLGVLGINCSKHVTHGCYPKGIHDGWDLVIAHPPCTYLANSGARWLFEKDGRWEALDEACRFFNIFLSYPAMVAIENPLPHKWAVERIGRKYDFKTHPWQHGHRQKKTTCFWTNGLPALVPTNVVGPPPKGDKSWESIWREPPGKDQAKNRSRTFQGIADAMADQWGGNNG